MSTEIHIKPRNLESLQTAFVTLADGKRPHQAKPEVQVEYEFGKGIRWNIVKNIRLLRQALDTFNDERIKLVKKHMGDKGKELNHPEMQAELKAFTDEYNKWSGDEMTVTGMLGLKLSLIFMDENKLPGSVVEMLYNYGLIIDDTPDEKPAASSDGKVVEMPKQS